MESDWHYLRALQARFPELGALLIRFNFHPVSYVHELRRADLMPSLPDSLWSVKRIHPQLSERILHQTGLLHFPAFVYPHWAWPLALLAPVRLKRLALHLGASVHGVNVRASLSRDHVLKWKEKLGGEAYEFAMTRASLLPPVKDMGTDLISVEPAQCGFCLLGSAALDMPEAMKTRFSWKLPKQVDEPDIQTVQARKLVRSVLSIVEPEWHSSTQPLSQ